MGKLSPCFKFAHARSLFLIPVDCTIEQSQLSSSVFEKKHLMFDVSSVSYLNISIALSDNIINVILAFLDSVSLKNWHCS